MIVKKNFLIFIISLVFLRFVLLFPFRLCAYSRFLNPLPILFVCVLVFTHFKKIKIDRIKIMFLILNFLVIFITAVQISSNISFWLVLLPRLSSVLYVMVFPLALLLLDWKSEDYLFVIRKLCYVMIWVGGSVAIINSILIYGFKISTFTIICWGFPIDLVKSYGSSYKFDGQIRMLGFLFNLEHSQLAVASATVFLLSEYLLNKKSCHKNLFITVIFGMITFPFYSSIIVNIVGYSTLLLCIYLFSQRRTKIITTIFFPFILTLSMYVNHISWGKLDYYLRKWQYFVSLFIPNFSGCYTKNFFWAPFRDAGYNGMCSFSEIHSLSYIPEFGLIPMLPWLLVLFSPLYFFSQYKKLPRSVLPSLLMMICYLGGAIHYSGVENWGNNYVFLLGLLSILTISLNKKKLSDQ